jgi:hypothetical protein
VKLLNKKSFVLGLLILLLTGAFFGFTPKSADSFGPHSQQQDVLVIDASDRDSTESEDDDDDEWEA